MKIEKIIPSTNYDKDLWEYLEEKSENYIQKFDADNKLFAKEDKKVYTGFGILADQQFGNPGVDYKKARTDAQRIGRTDNAFGILGGDGIDNFILASQLAPLIKQEVNTENQVLAFEQYLGFFNDHILAAISGNHELRSDNVTGIDILKKLFKNKLYYSKHEFKIEFMLNNITYRIYIRHKYRFNSQQNLTNAPKQLIRMGDWADTDVAIVCHHHEYDVESFMYKGEKRLAIRPGSYLVADDYARSCGFSKSKSLMPFLIFSPFTKEIIDFDNIETGCDYLEFLNKGVVNESGQTRKSNKKTKKVQKK